MYQPGCQWLFRFLAFYSNPSNMPIVFPCISNETLMYPYTACDVISMGFWLKYCLLNLIELANLQIITRPTDILLWMHNLLHHEERWIADRTVLPYHQVTGVLLYGKWKRLVSDHIRSWSSFLIQTPQLDCHSVRPKIVWVTSLIFQLTRFNVVSICSPPPSSPRDCNNAAAATDAPFWPRDLQPRVWPRSYPTWNKF